MIKKISIFLIFFISHISEARVFNFKSESVGAYFNATGASSLLSKDSFDSSSGASSLFTDSFSLNSGFELGMLMIPATGLTLTLSVQGIRSDILTEIKAKNISGTDLMSLTSSVFALNSKLSMEIDISNSGTARSYFHLGAGYSDISLNQEYSFTATGKSTYSISSDSYFEKSGAMAISYTSGFGYEFLAVDNVTMNLELGYRVLPVKNLTYKAAYSELIQSPGSASKGDEVLNNDGSKRNFNFGGAYIGIGFRFYINTI